MTPNSMHFSFSFYFHAMVAMIPVAVAKSSILCKMCQGQSATATRFAGKPAQGQAL